MYTKKFFSHFFIALAAIASMFTLITTFFNIQWQSIYFLGIRVAYLAIAIIILVCVIYSILQIKRKKSIKLSISDNFKVTIKEGDLFEEKGIIVIPVDEYFNTHVGDGIINPRSVHGQFIQKFFNERIKELDNKIQDSLKSQEIHGEYVSDSPFRDYLKDRKYELGTCIIIQDGGNDYIWVVSTEYDDNNLVRLNRKDYSILMNKLFSFLEIHATDKGVFMPLIGAGNARLNCSSERILHYLIDYFGFSLLEKKIIGGVNVVIPSIKDINLNRIDEIFN